PVPAGEGGEQRDLLGREAAQAAVPYQVRGVTMVPVVGDVLADVVQERGVLEHLPVVRVEPVQFGCLVEQLDRKTRDLAGGVLGGRLGDGTGVGGRVGRVMGPDDVEQDAFAQ